MPWRQAMKPYLLQAKLRFEFGDPHFKIDEKIVRKLKDLSYVEQWRNAKDEKWFHLSLDDHSLFLFRTLPKPSFSFFDCPLKAQSISDYLKNFEIAVTADNVRRNLDEYQNYLSTCRLKPYVTPIRYDLDQNSYRQGTHPAAHIHIGLDNHIRIGLRRELTPLAFLLFIIRQRYPENWAQLISTPLGKTITKKMRSDLPELDAIYFSAFDECEHYLM